MSLRLLGLLAAAATLLSVQATTAHPHAAAAAPPGTGSVSGRVTYTDGRPVPRYPVDYFRASNPARRDSVRTDSEGRYVISGLADGAWFVGFFHPDRLPPDRNPHVVTLPDPSPELVEIGAPMGQQIVIADGQAVDGIDFVMTDVGAELTSPNGVETGTDELGLPAAGGAPSPTSDGTSAVGFAALFALGAIALTLGGWSALQARRRSR